MPIAEQVAWACDRFGQLPRLCTVQYSTGLTFHQIIRSRIVLHCIGHSGVLSPSLRRPTIHSPSRTRSPVSCRAFWLNTAKIRPGFDGVNRFVVSDCSRWNDSWLYFTCRIYTWGTSQRNWIYMKIYFTILRNRNEVSKMIEESAADWSRHAKSNMPPLTLG